MATLSPIRCRAVISPNSQLEGNGNLVFQPTPNQVGTYDFTVTASDGTTSVSQNVSLTVIPDPLTTTRISGQVLDTDGNPLANLPLELGRLQAVTDAQGYFTITLPDSSIPTEEINIKIPLGDPAFDPFFTGEQEINLRRTTFDGTTGTGAANPLRHPNLVTTFMDASMVYGSDENRANALRTLDGTGKLKTSSGDLLPFNSSDYFANGPLANNNRSLSDPAELFAAGDVRANENIGLTALHTVFVREHNRLADEISLANSGLSGEEVYQRARKLVSAQIQRITYQEYLPLLLGEGAITAYSGYDSSVDPSISHLFSAAAFRLGHTQSFDEFLLIDAAGQNLPSVSLRESTFNPEVIQQNGIDAILRGLVAQSAEAVDLKVLDDLRNTLFGPPGSGGIDLAAVDIERGRDVGLPDYNQAREDFGLARVTSFAEITADTTIQAALTAIYGDVDNIDVIVGGLAEDKAPGAMVGELFQTIMADQFARLRDGDRFWYENAQFSQTDLDFIRGTQLSDLIERNTAITGLSGNIFSSSLNPTGPAAGGSAAASSTAEYAAIDGSNNNLVDPELGTVGTHMRVDYTQEYGDGIRTPGGAERLNTRAISNALFTQDTSVPDALGATGILLAWSQFMGHDFTFSPAGAADTLKVYGDQYNDPNGESFPFVAEKLDLMLGHEVYAGVDNVIDRPIYLPVLDLASNSQSTDAQGNVTISNSTLGAAVFVANNSLEDREGNPFSGTLSITEVPSDLTPAALPERLSPDLVVTIQPSDLVFTDPAELTLPNGGGWPPGTEMNLWSINPNTGDFEIVGQGTVTDDGSTIETTAGGIRNSSWHFFTPFAPPTSALTVKVEESGCDTCPAGKQLSSEVNLNTGGVIETHTLPSYQSLGIERGVQLVYDSLRADARHIVQFGGQVSTNTLTGTVSPNARLVANMTVHNGNYDYQVPGFAGEITGLRRGSHIWNLANRPGQISAAMQADLRSFESGVYDFSMLIGTYVQREGFVGSSRNETGQLIHINTASSAFGSGWGLAGVQELVESPDGSVLLIDGDGSELLFEVTADGYQSPPGDFSTVEKLSDGTFRRTTKDQTVYAFDSENRLVSVTDANGNQTQHVYNNGQLTKIIDPVGLETLFSYTAGRLSSITDPANRITQFAYDTAGNLTQITDPDRTIRTFEYDQDHHMTAEVDKRGNREEAFYDFAGRATHAIDKTGAVIQVSPAQTKGLYRPELTSVTSNVPAVSTQAFDSASYADANGNVSQYTLDAAGQTLSSMDGGGSRGLSERNADNLVTQRFNGRGQATRYTYDEQGNLLSVEDEISRGSVPREGFFTGRITRSGSPLGITTADVNNDGHLDYITANTLAVNGNQSVFYGDSQGNFSSSQPLFWFENSGARRSGSSVRATDLDQDGNADLIVLEKGYGYSSAAPTVSLLWGNGDGSFERTPLLNQSGSEGFSLLVQDDIDGDGDDDLLVKDYVLVAGSGYQQQIKALFNQGDQTFTETVLIAVAEDEFNRSEVQLGDLDGDGDLDAILYVELASSSGGTSGIRTSLYTGDETFSTPQLVVSADDYYSPLWSLDVNQDGNDDLLLRALEAPGLEIYLSAGDGTFTAPTIHTLDGALTEESQIRFADVNADGRRDLIAVDGDSDQVTVALANLQGGFDPVSLYDIGDYETEVYNRNETPLTEGDFPAFKTADIDGNSALDIITANYNEDTLTVLYNDGNGLFERVDYDAGQQPVGIAIEDFNQDGRLDIISAVRNNFSGEENSNVFLENVDGQLEPQTNVSFQADATLPVSTNSGVEKTLADLNDDGFLDFISFQGNGDLVIAYGNGDSFSPPVVRSIVGPNGENPRARDFEVDDIDGDGFQDIVFTARFSRFNNFQNRVWMLKGNGTANGILDFDPLESIDMGFSARGFGLGDFNGDGQPDIHWGDSNKFKLLLNNALGTAVFTATDVIDLPVNGNFVTIGDVNNDGRDEFLWERSERNNNQRFSYLSAFALQPDGSVAAVAEYDLNGAADYSQLDRFDSDISVAQIVDLNQDGLNDLVVAHELSYNFWIGRPLSLCLHHSGRWNCAPDRYPGFVK
ncbi:MAG: hypothetical protein F6K00_33985 [Leptolyngbya sp. SIOISBB]|nr:hypothetical protein [Leptolyngbya sp. SIOISBB]